MTKRQLEELLKDMSLQEKIDQMVQLPAGVLMKNGREIITGPLSDLHITQEELDGLGSILGTYDPDELNRIQKEQMERQPHHIPMLFMLDVINSNPEEEPEDQIYDQQQNSGKLGIDQHEFIVLLPGQPDRKPLTDCPVLFIHIIETFRPDRDLGRIVLEVCRGHLPIDGEEVQTVHRIEQPPRDQNIPNEKRQNNSSIWRMRAKSLP